MKLGANRVIIRAKAELIA